MDWTLLMISTLTGTGFLGVFALHCFWSEPSGHPGQGLGKGR